MILVFHDRGGDIVPVDTDRIACLEAVTLKYEDDSSWTCTLIKLGGSQVAVAESIGVVYERWMQARGETVAVKAPSPAEVIYPSAVGWKLHPELAADGKGGQLT